MQTQSLQRCFLVVGLLFLFLATSPEMPVLGEAPGGATTPGKGDTDGFSDPLPRFARARFGTVRWRHGRAVLAVAFHPDGKTLVSTGEDRTVRIWDVSSGKVIRKLEGLGWAVWSIAFDAKGNRLAGIADDQLWLWDYRSGRRLWTQRANREQGKAEHLSAIAFSPDGSTLATAGLFEGVFLWDAETGRQLARFPYDPPPKDYDRHINPSVSFSQDGRLVACGSGNDRGYIWSVESGKKVWTAAPAKCAQTIAFSPDGNLFASVAGRHRLTLWDVASRKPVGQIAGDCSETFQFSPDGKLLVSADNDIGFWEVPSGKKRGKAKWVFPDLSGRCDLSVFSFAPDGKSLAWAGTDNRVHLVDVATGEESALTRAPAEPLDSIAFSPDGSTVALGCQKKLPVYVWDPTSQRDAETWPCDTGGFHVLGFSPDGRTLAATDGRIQLWDRGTGKKTRINTDEDTHSGAMAGAWTSNGLLVSRSWDGTVHVCDPKIPHKGRRLQASDPVLTIAVSTDGRFLAGGGREGDGREGAVHVWDLKTDREVRHLRTGRWGEIHALAFSPDGRTVAAGGEIRAIFLWELASGKLCLQLQLPSDTGVQCLGFSQDGRFLASASSAPFVDSGSRAPVVSMWDLAAEKEVAKLAGHQGLIRALAFSPDGKTLGTVSDDSTALLWRWREALPLTDRPTARITAAELERCWRMLAGEDARQAHRAIWTLAAAPEQVVPFLGSQIPPVPFPDTLRIGRLIGDLESDNLATREQASRELATLGGVGEPQLRKVLDNRPPAETRRRIKELLEQLDGLVLLPKEVRNLRALAVLEQCGTQESMTVLKGLANGAPGARLTQDAKAVLDRAATGKSFEKR
jgi:WD40 repeat protein